MTTFDDYQVKASKTAMYPEKGTASALALSYVALGLGECNRSGIYQQNSKNREKQAQ